MGKIPIDLTFVEFVENDFVGEILAYFSLLPVALVVCEISFFCARREINVFLYGLGQIVNEFVNMLLKKIIAQERPSFDGDDDNDNGGRRNKSLGMPSNHAQFMGFFCILSLLVIWSFDSKVRALKHRPFLSLTVVIASFLTCYSRIYLGYHTILQVIVGFIIGGLFAILWKIFIVQSYIIRNKIVPFLIHHPLFGDYYHLRDTSNIVSENIFLLEQQLTLKKSGIKQARTQE